MNKTADYYKLQLYNCCKAIEQETGVQFQSWRSVFDHGSYEWDEISDKERKVVTDWLKVQNKGSDLFTTVISDYSALNELLDRDNLNKSCSYLFLKGP